MPESRIPKSFSLDTGIEQILWGDKVKTANLPEDRGAITPSADLPDARLERLFNAPSLENFIAGLLKPSLKDKGLLIPARYQVALRHVRDLLKQMAEGADDSEEGRTLEDAAALLEQEDGLMELLNTYRNILHRA
jgi:hypothetical protein